MANNISLAIFGTFGSPNGFTQRTVGQFDKVDLYDLNPNAIQLFESTKSMYAIRKEVMGDTRVISFIKYSYASEKESSRGGTFVGAAVIYVNGIADAASTIKTLDELHHNLVSNPRNVENGVIMTKHANEFKIATPQIKLNVRSENIDDIAFSQSSNNLVVFMPFNNLNTTIERSLDLLNQYEVVYFTEDRNVAEYVNKKGLYELIQEVGNVKQFSQKLKQIEALKEKKQKQLADKVRKEIEGQLVHKKTILEKFNSTLDKNKKIHKENEEKIKSDEKKVYDFSSKFDVYINLLRKLDQKLTEGLFNETERRELEKEREKITSSLNSLRGNLGEPTRISNISNSVRSEQVVDRIQRPFDPYSTSPERPKQGFSSKDILFIVVMAFALGLGGFIVYDMLSEKNPPNVMAEVNTHDDNTAATDKEVSLFPSPNDSLSSRQIRRMFDGNLPNHNMRMHKDSLVNLIFSKYKEEGVYIYSGREKEYGDFLMFKNANKFRDSLLIGTDSLYIPMCKNCEPNK